MSYLGVPGHCWGLDGSEWHDPGECRALDCDHECCKPSPVPGMTALKRDALMMQVSDLFERHNDYKQVMFQREVIGDTEILTAIFFSAANNEVAQHILEAT